MSNIVELFEEDDGSGYLTADNCKKITGVYVNNLAVMVDNGNVYVGNKAVDGIDDELLTTIKDMDKFCIMWLCINKPGVINEITK